MWATSPLGDCFLKRYDEFNILIINPAVSRWLERSFFLITFLSVASRRTTNSTSKIVRICQILLIKQACDERFTKRKKELRRLK